MRQANYHTAMVTLRTCLHHLTQDIVENGVHESSRGTVPSNQQLFGRKRASLSHKFPVQSPQIETVALREVSDHMAFGVYNNALRITPSLEVDQHADLVSAVTLYNLAIIYHLQGVKGSTKVQEIYLVKALKLYQMAGAILQPFFVEHGDGMIVCPSYIMVMLAVHNNMGHIHFVRMDHGSFVDCCDVLQALLRMAERSGLLTHQFFIPIYLNGVMFCEHSMGKLHAPCA